MNVSEEIKKGIIETLKKGTFEKVSVEADMIELEPEGDVRRYKAGERLHYKITIKLEDKS
ncbi:hypothetical protein LCGC14_2211900 [marine sediment metagenome]|uniref:Uncharacterized protein n=1 Tax=marine sediment metagenome TaxID=412755 RepID=A0A0F9G980_9ZZZZ